MGKKLVPDKVRCVSAVRLSCEEYGIILGAATQAGLPLSTWMRLVSLDRAKSVQHGGCERCERIRRLFMEKV